MAVKELGSNFRPLLKLYIVIGSSTLYFLTLFVVSYVTQALTVLVASYQVLCNLVLLLGNLITLKRENDSSTKETACPKECVPQNEVEELKTLSVSHCGHSHYLNVLPKEKELRNTFGWVRIDVLLLLVSSVLLASFSFSVMVEALQTLVHIDHHEIHHPAIVFTLGVVGIILSLLRYCLIEGSILHRTDGLKITTEGDVIVQEVQNDDNKNKDLNQESNQISGHCFLNVIKDNICFVFIIVCALSVSLTECEIAKYIDPVLALTSTALLAMTHFSSLQESCFVLLQTIPNHIDIKILQSQLLSTFPVIVNVHDLHVWQLTSHKYVSTAHIVFLNAQDYSKINNDITRFFSDRGITHVTVQPEFYKEFHSKQGGVSECLVRCNGETCLGAVCCSYDNNLKFVTILPSNENKEIIDENINVNMTEQKSIFNIPNKANQEETANDNLSIKFQNVVNESNLVQTVGNKTDV